MASLAARLVQPSATQSSFDRLEIYHHQYWLRLREAFSEDFPVLESLLGTERFRSLIEAYLFRHPPTSPILRDVGSRLPRFLVEEPDRAAPHPQRLVLDLARFEWAKIVSFHSPELPLPREEEMATPAIRLFLQPHLALLDLRYPVDEWGPENPPPQSTVSSPLSPKPRRIIVHRQGGIVYHKLLQREAFSLLRSFAKGLSLLQACERTAQKHPGLPPERYREWFQEWSSLGWLTAQPSSLGRSASSETS